jgi:hypothetical protein
MSDKNSIEAWKPKFASWVESSRIGTICTSFQPDCHTTLEFMRSTQQIHSVCLRGSGTPESCEAAG